MSRRNKLFFFIYLAAGSFIGLATVQLFVSKPGRGPFDTWETLAYVPGIAIGALIGSWIGDHFKRSKSN
ncbi:MAG TPA: hypothetical protein VGL56_00660 [Fimbriimonadaceae bacterium]